MCERSLESPLVGDEHAHRHVVGQRDRLQYLLGVGELRDDVGTDEARDLDPPEPGAPEQLDQPHLLGRRDHLGFVLKAVPRTDLPDANLVRKRAHSGDSMDA